jgi:hypothetical protein
MSTRGPRPAQVGGLACSVGYPGAVFTLFAIQSTFMTIVTVALFALQAWAFLDAVARRPDAFVAADKLTKAAWLIILGIALGAHMLIWNPVSILNLLGAVAAIVYIVDARPAMQGLTRR